MTRKLQILRGTTAQNNAYTGAVGELTMDTDRNEVRIHDGQTVGGIKISDRNMPILTSMFFDHITNDMSWLRADNFTWQSGDVYVAAYEHLLTDYNSISPDVLYAFKADENNIYYTKILNGTVDEEAETFDANGVSASHQHGLYWTSSGDLETGKEIRYYRTPAEDVLLSTPASKSETISGITITYYQAADGHKICLPDQESNIVALYEKTGAADYYILDTTNKQFKLPRKQKRTLIQVVKNTNGTWYNLYSDGWVEQGGDIPTNTSSISLPVEMENTTYMCIISYRKTSSATTVSFATISTHTQTTTGFTCISSASTYKSWQVSGYAAESAYASAGMRLEYYYVGNFEQSAIEQTAGITAETLNGKADTDLGNIPTNYDYVVESQMPTAANGYTWYRKYKSGWVEQGGRLTMPATNAYSLSDVVITLPVPIQEPESAVLSYSGLNASENFANCENQAALSTTTATIGRWNNGNSTAATRSYMWVLYGQAQ